jgi:hypothetical protein
MFHLATLFFGEKERDKDEKLTNQKGISSHGQDRAIQWSLTTTGCSMQQWFKRRKTD